MTLTYGEMFAGYGGLGMGVQSVLGGSMKWCAEFDPAPFKILAAHWPDVPNLGDVTKIDWASVPRVDVITGGSPCQDLSHAGKRAGMKAGTRSGLWASMCDAIDIIRPSLVVWENVRGALSAEADSGMESCPGCVGDPDDGPVLRALGRVLGDLADLGYDASWYGLRAADVGAPHGRFRIFVFASPSDASLRGGDASTVAPTRDGHDTTGRCGCGVPATDSRGGSLAGAGADGNGLRLTAERGPVAPAYADSAGCLEHGRPVPTGPKLAATEHDRDLTADAGVQRHGRGQDRAGLGRVDGGDAGETRQRQRAREVAGDRGPEAATDAGRQPWEQGCALSGCDRQGRQANQPERFVKPTDWGQYAPAINRWERVLGRRAPTPTETGPKGGQRLSPRFVEWLMGLPEGHVTDVKISRNDQLKALGNGVVPQQAAEATRRFLAFIQAEAVA